MDSIRILKIQEFLARICPFCNSFFLVIHDLTINSTSYSSERRQLHRTTPASFYLAVVNITPAVFMSPVVYDSSQFFDGHHNISK